MANRQPAASDHVEVRVVAGIPEKIGDQERNKTAGRQCPADHVGVGDRANAEITAGSLVKRDKLDGPKSQPQQYHHQ